LSPAAEKRKKKRGRGDRRKGQRARHFWFSPPPAENKKKKKGAAIENRETHRRCLLPLPPEEREGREGGFVPEGLMAEHRVPQWLHLLLFDLTGEREEVERAEK